MLHKVFPDKERAKSIITMAFDREKFLISAKIDYQNIIIENYYEIIKELASALLLLNGLKAIGENAHKEIIDSLRKYADFNDYQISILQDLRIKRNKSLYEGEQVDLEYLKGKKEILNLVIDKLKNLLADKLK